MDGYRRYPGKQYPGFDIKKLQNSNHVQCSEDCEKDKRCMGFVFHPNIKTCWIKYQLRTNNKNFRTYAGSDLYLRIGGHKGKIIDLKTPM